MITPDGPAPASPILGDEAAALGFPAAVQVIKMANAPGPGRYGEAWACVTDPRRLLLGWAQRLAGTDEWQIIAEPVHGSGKAAALFDGARGRRDALAKLGELARLTIVYAQAAPLDVSLPPRAQAVAVVAALEGPRVGGGPYLEAIEIMGVTYAYRPVALAEIEAMAAELAAGRGDVEKLATAVGVLRSLLAPEAVEHLVGRLRDHGDPLDHTAVLEALSTIVGRRGMDDPEQRARGLEARGYVHTVVIGGVGYLHRLMTLEEIEHMARAAAPGLELSERVAVFWSVTKAVLEAGDLAALEARMSDPADDVDEVAMIAALTEIAEKG